MQHAAPPAIYQFIVTTVKTTITITMEVTYLIIVITVILDISTTTAITINTKVINEVMIIRFSSLTCA